LDYNIIRQFAIDNGIDFIAVYGSFYKGNANENNDLDLIFDTTNKTAKDTLDQLSLKLGNLLNIQVDLITPRQMIPSLLCGYVWRLKEYEVIYGEPVVLELRIR
jgi:predicted nucleotidyltransferase